MDSPTFYAIIPANVRYCKGLKPNAKLLYGEITALCNRDGYCWAENAYFAELYEVSEETVSRWISDLKKFGFVSIEMENEGRFVRKISLDKNVKALDEKVKNPLTKRSTPLDEKIKHNNTINNTINREVNALCFLEENYPLEYENLLMKYQSKISDFEKAKADFNLQFDVEDRAYEMKIIFSRAQLFFNRWIENQDRYSVKQFSSDVQIQNNNPSRKRFEI